MPAMWETWVQSLHWEDSPGEGNSYPFQYSSLENSMDYIVHGVANNRIPLSNFHFFIYFFFFLVSRISHSKFSSGKTTFSFLVIFIIFSSFLNLLILSCSNIQSLVFFFSLSSFLLWFTSSLVVLSVHCLPMILKFTSLDQR